MENAELDVALEELESRLERLRALYEQYFMGIERIEPAIPRKDIDRRIYVLRREKIRNTAKRFKLQTIISRYNTFQQYWQRICREIEAGTYKRHVIKAERILPGKLLTIAARKRLGRHVFDDVEGEAEPTAPTAPSSAPPPAPATARPASSVPARPASSVPAPPSVPRPTPAAGAPTLKGAPPAKPQPPPKPGARPAKPLAPGSPLAPAAPHPFASPPPPASPLRPTPPVAAKPFESLDLDMDFMGDWDPSSAPAKPARGDGAPARPFGEALARPLGAPIKTPARAAVAPPARAPAPVAAPTAMPKAAALAKPAAAPPAATPAKPAAAPPTATPAIDMPTRVAAAPGLPAPPKAAPMPTAPTPTKPAAAASAPMPPKPAAATPPLAPQPAPVAAKPAPAAAISPAAKLGAAPMAKATKPAATPGADLTDARVRELHARLLEAKRETKDAGAVSLEGLAKSLKATEAKLREQHKNRKIDFDVVIKDGKAILKPTVR